MRDSMVFYRSFWEAIEELPEEEFKKTVSAIMKYGLYEEEPEVSGITKAIFTLCKPQIDANNKRYRNGNKGGRPKTKQESNDNQYVTESVISDNQTITKQKPNNNQEITKAKPNDNDNVNVNVNDNVNVKNKRRFTPPTEEEVRAYCEERGNCVDPQTFINFYDSKGWMIGKNRMKDWKAAVRTWERSGRSDQTRQEVTAKRDRFNNFPSRSYDMDNLERQLLGE